MRCGEKTFTLEAKPLLFYTNPVRATDQHGTIFLWTDRGRPAVFGSVWSALNRTDSSLRNITHEWHSLVEEPDVQAVRGGQTDWTSGEPGIAWQSLDGETAPAPASSRAGRLSQMREIARGLTASITAEEANELRLMTQPLYRYPEKTVKHQDRTLWTCERGTPGRSNGKYYLHWRVEQRKADLGP
jgi:hypothetical protein